MTDSTSTTFRGRILYTTDGKGPEGFEDFSVSRASDGTRTLTAHCEMHNDGLLRDVVLRVGDGFSPEHAFVSVSVDGRFVGAGLYDFRGPRVTLDRLTPHGRERLQRRATAATITAFGSHSVQNDAWLYASFDAARGDATESTLDNAVISSRLSNGGDGPALLFSSQRHRFLGEETVTVGAGTFACRRYQFLFEEWPAIDYWVHSEDYLLVRCRWDHLSQTYELVELDVHSPDPALPPA